jgi:hypothetical protein
MTNFIKTTLFFLYISSVSFCQDVLSLKNGTEIKVKVVEIDQDFIKYKRYDNLNGPLIWISKSDVGLITYENGTKDVIEVPVKAGETVLPPVLPKTTDATEDMYVQGETDARLNYKGKNSGAVGTFLVGLLSPAVALIPAIACSGRTPDITNLNAPDQSLLKNETYRRGYQYKAKKMKQGKVWGAWGASFGLALIVNAAIANN